MDQCLAILKRASREVPAPQIVKTLSGGKVSEILRRDFRIDRSKIIMADRDYGIYSRADLERFLNRDLVDKKKYVKEAFDCDDFAKVLLGRERVWYKQAPVQVASTFGVVHGDIRVKEADTKIRPHAVNFFIDENEKVQLIEPQTDKFHEITSNSTFWTIFV